MRMCLISCFGKLYGAPGKLVDALDWWEVTRKRSSHGGRALDMVAGRGEVAGARGWLWGVGHGAEGVRPRSCCSYRRGARSSVDRCGHAGAHGTARARGQACTGALATVEHIASAPVLTLIGTSLLLLF
jgi:hypothetical protein